MPTITILKEDLIYAMEDHGGEHNWYLDKETGEIFFVSEYDSDEDDEYAQKVEEYPDRYICIDPLESRDSYRIMEDYIFSLSDPTAKRSLENAISRRRPFSNFKDALYDFPEIQKQWFIYHDNAVLQISKEWLEFEKIDFRLIDYKDTL